VSEEPLEPKSTPTGTEVPVKASEGLQVATSVGEQPPVDSGKPSVAGGSMSAGGGQPSAVSGLTSKCGCCRGLAAETPATVLNRSGLSAIAYRVGTHAQFKRSMLAGLSTSERTALAGLRTRDDDDFSIALLDAWAMVADVLTFYQERLANESYLRTATERRSILELARLTGYQPSPGVAASVCLAFTVDDAQGAPGEAVVDVGTKVQSVPGQNETAQTFETIESATVRAEWNEVKPATTRPTTVSADTETVYFTGTDTKLKPGDGILIVKTGDESFWDFCIVTSVEEDFEKKRTKVDLSPSKRASGSTLPYGSDDNLGFYAMSLQASLFGHNAPAWYMACSNSTLTPTQFSDNGIAGDWIDLDAVYPAVGVGTRAVLLCGNYSYLCPGDTVTTVSRSDFGVTGRVTQIGPIPTSNPGPSDFELRTTAAYIQTEELELAEEPMTATVDLLLKCEPDMLAPVQGDVIELDRQVWGLETDKRLMLSGKPVRVRFGATPEGACPADVFDGVESYILLEAPVSTDEGQAMLIGNRAGDESSVVCGEDNSATLMPSQADDGVVAEPVEVKSVTGEIEVTLQSSLSRIYDRETVAISANVILATHGESVSEVLGSGDASRPYQTFDLKQSPLTHVAASNPTGAESTLAVLVNDVLRNQAPYLYGRSADERVYVSRTDDDGVVTVEFGDGETGARVMTGQENVTATYRKGIGLAGNVRAGQLTMLMTRPLGVKGVTNPCAATGAQDTETRDQARQTAPTKVLTLDRAVSLQDYEDYARTFAGIDKALATWTRLGERSAIVLTVAGPEGVTVDEDGETADALREALRDYGDPYVPILIRSFRPSSFTLAADVQVAPDYLWENVQPLVETALLSAFSFDARSFGQPVALSEVVTVIQNLSGVAAVHVTLLQKNGTSGLEDPLPAELPEADAGAEVQGAELLTIDPDGLELTEMEEASG
jgi:hypothetical protein